MSNIDFEQDQEKLLGKTDNIQSLADQVERLDQLLKEIELDENLLKQKTSKKKELESLVAQLEKDAV